MNVRDAEHRIKTLSDMMNVLDEAGRKAFPNEVSYETEALSQIYKKLLREKNFISEQLRKIDYPIKEDYGFWEE